MLTKELGRTGVMVPEIGIGTWDYHAGPTVLRRGLETGALFIDTAESYGSEPAVGEALRGLRDKVFVATKVSAANFGASDFLRAIDGSLKRMGIDTIDLLQLHEPNPSIPLAETMGVLSQAIEAGKVRFAGVSNFSVLQMQESQSALGRHPLVANQVRYNLIERTIERDVLPYCQQRGISVIAYCPLARGLDRVKDCDPHGVLTQVSQETGRSVAQIVINWCLAKPGVFAIPKGNSVEHVLENCAASDWRLTEEQLRLLDTRVQFRHRTRLETMLKASVPGPLIGLAKRAVGALPRGLRRHVR